MTHCKFKHKTDTECRNFAISKKAVGAAYSKPGGTRYCILFFPPFVTCSESASNVATGFYQEWSGGTGLGKVEYRITGANGDATGYRKCFWDENWPDPTIPTLSVWELFNDRGDSELSKTASYEYTLAGGFKCTLSGWTHTRQYAKGFVANDNNPEPNPKLAVVSGLTPGARYRFSVYQYAEIVGHQGINKLTVTGDSATAKSPYSVDQKASDTYATYRPTAVDVAVASVSGTLTFRFIKEIGHVHLSGIEITPIVYPPVHSQSWRTATGACNSGVPAMTHCKFKHKTDTECRNFAISKKAVGAAYSKPGGTRYCILFFPPFVTCSESASNVATGFYQEWSGGTGLGKVEYRITGANGDATGSRKCFWDENWPTAAV